jgi:UDP-N-acetylmuramate--alanine ligase
MRIIWVFFPSNLLLGKTTTTSMLSTIVGECNSIIGDGSGSYSDNDILIIESCEYKNTFLKYNPYIALILNIDYDHPDFFSSLDDYIDAFRLFINNSKIVIANGDDENVLKLDLDELITYGMNDYNDYCFSVIEGKNKTLIMINNVRFVIPLVGLHYAYDFVGAYLCAKFIGVSDSDIKSRLKAYKLPSRRLEERNIDEMIFVNDYAHHPTEINALHDTLRIKYSGYKLVCFFQPHTISRSLALLDEFKEKLSLFDETYILKTFTSVREGYDKGKEEYIMDYWGFPKVEEFRVFNYNFSKKNVYIFVGAGDINKLFNKIVKI